MVLSIVDYLNPFSENFFLRIAFVPREGYLKDKVSSTFDKASKKFPAISQLKDSFSALLTSTSDVTSWEGIKVNFSRYGIGEVVIVSPAFVNLLGNKLKFWISGCIWFMFVLYFLRRIPSMWG